MHCSYDTIHVTGARHHMFHKIRSNFQTGLIAGAIAQPISQECNNCSSKRKHPFQTGLLEQLSLKNLCMERNKNYKANDKL